MHFSKTMDSLQDMWGLSRIWRVSSKPTFLMQLRRSTGKLVLFFFVSYFRFWKIFRLRHGAQLSKGNAGSFVLCCNLISLVPSLRCAKGFVLMLC